MRLRKLKLTDSSLMLEWMHDDNVVHNLTKNFKEMMLSDCEKFIKACTYDKSNIHFAIVDSNDEYMGTVSLKNIVEYETAEFAICMRTCAMGKGFSEFAMKQILKMGFLDMGLKSIYWCVNRNNMRALRFYDKLGYKTISTPPL